MNYGKIEFKFTLAIKSYNSATILLFTVKHTQTKI
jgi:hypothetical protein